MHYMMANCIGSGPVLVVISSRYQQVCRTNLFIFFIYYKIVHAVQDRQNGQSNIKSGRLSRSIRHSISMLAVLSWASVWLPDTNECTPNLDRHASNWSMVQLYRRKQKSTLRPSGERYRPCITPCHGTDCTTLDWWLKHKRAKFIDLLQISSKTGRQWHNIDDTVYLCRCAVLMKCNTRTAET